jgi:hypothetical protein
VSQPGYGPPPVPPVYPPQQGQPEWGPPQPQAPEKKPLWKRTWFRVVAALFVIAVIGSAMSDDKKDEAASATSATGAAEGASDAPAPAEEVAPEPANPGIGQPAADGKFSFVVSGVDCSRTELGDQYFGTKAQGQFCIVDVAVTNIGDKAQSFFGDNASLFNAQDQEFSADNEAAIYLEDSSSLYEEVNPGNTLNSKVVFDVPVGTTPTAIELHDSAFSGGVTVNLQ